MRTEMVGRLAAGSVVVAVLLGVPTIAWAGAESYQFDATQLGNQRLPADPASDFPAPEVGNGSVTSDIDGTACDSTYAVQLIRARPFFPDEVVHRFDGGRACDGLVTQAGLSWPAGRFHFDARVTLRQESQFGRGFVRADW